MLDEPKANHASLIAPRRAHRPVFVALVLTLLCLGLSIPARASDERRITIDLTRERDDYKRLAFNRDIGLALALATALSGGASAVGYASAFGSKGQIMNEPLPLNLAERQSIVASGQRANELGLVCALLTVAAGLGSAYFLSASF